MVSGLIAGVLVSVALAALVWLVGLALPQKHVVTRRLAVSRPPDEVWALVSDLGGQITWRSAVKGVSKTVDAEAGVDPGAVGEVWREVMGRHTLDLKTLEATPP